MTEKKSTPSSTKTFMKDNYVPTSVGQKSYTPSTGKPDASHVPTSQGAPTSTPAPKTKPK